MNTSIESETNELTDAIVTPSDVPPPCFRFPEDPTDEQLLTMEIPAALPGNPLTALRRFYLITLQGRARRRLSALANTPMGGQQDNGDNGTPEQEGCNKS